MRTIRLHASRQVQALIVVGIALAAVLAYSAWGSYLLHHQAEAPTPSLADSR
jgi:hypothetical protein